MKNKFLLINILTFGCLALPLTSCNQPPTVLSKATVELSYNSEICSVEVINEKENYSIGDKIGLNITFNEGFELSEVTLNNEKIENLGEIELKAGNNFIKIYSKILNNDIGSTNIRDFTFELNSDDTYSIISYYPSGVAPKRLEIPSIYKNKTVSKIIYKYKEDGSALSSYSFSEIEEIYIPGTIKNISSEVFLYGESIKSYDVSYENSKYKSINGYLYSKDGRILYSAPRIVEDGIVLDSGTKTIAPYAFYKANHISSFTLNEGLIEIGYRAFYGCNKITSITIPSTVTTIAENCFETCSSLQSITLSSSLVSLESNVFNRCTKLKSINIPGSVKEIKPYAFYSCTELRNVTLNEGLEIIGDNSFCYTDIDKIDLPSSVRKVGAHAFAACINLKEVILNEGLVEIGEYCFNLSRFIERINIPSTVNLIGEGAFTACLSISEFDVHASNQNFTSIEGVLFSKDVKTLIAYPNLKDTDDYHIPSGTEIIGFRAFNFISASPYEEVYYCYSLKNLYIPTSVTKIENAIYGGRLENVYYEGTTEQFQNVETTMLYENQTIEWNTGSMVSVIHCTDGDLVYDL